MPTDSNAIDAAEGRQLVITRTFDAPRTLVFKAFAEAERLARWWGPKGCTIHVSRLDFRPGGEFHYRMAFPGGHEMWGRFIYREIVAPERIVWVNTFSDPDGNLVKAPFEIDFPLEILNIVTLEEQNGKTLLTLRGGPINETAEQRAVYEGMFDSMRQGFGGTWDQLEAYLATEHARA
jgi:uncharacterized protein YndB with AHSA1/START domain